MSKQRLPSFGYLISVAIEKLQTFSDNLDNPNYSDLISDSN